FRPAGRSHADEQPRFATLPNPCRPAGPSSGCGARAVQPGASGWTSGASAAAGSAAAFVTVAVLAVVAHGGSPPPWVVGRAPRAGCRVGTGRTGDAGEHGGDLAAQRGEAGDLGVDF